MQSPLPLIETHKLSKHFGDIDAVKSLDLTIPEHSITGFLGPNGAGKSTTIKLLLGLMRPSNGIGKIFGLDIVKDSADIRRRVGYLGQSPQFYPNMTAREILRFTAKFFYVGPKPLIEDRVNEMINMVGLEKKADRPVKGFSGGERQRLGIAQAQINYPDLLILDEPAAALDPMGRQDVLKIMENLRDKTTLFYSTHILDDVQKVSDRVVILNQGVLIAQGPIEDLLKSGRKIVYNVHVEGYTDRAFAKLKIVGLDFRYRSGFEKRLFELENSHYRSRNGQEIIITNFGKLYRHDRLKLQLRNTRTGRCLSESCFGRK